MSALPRRIGFAAAGWLAMGALVGSGLARAESPATDEGRMLFTHEWAVNDPLAPAGDGLGPMYNEKSCVACHFQGGPGGSGPAAKNAQNIAFSVRPVPELPPLPALQSKPNTPQALVEQEFLVGQRAQAELARRRELAAADREHRELIEIHPGFARSSGFVFHRYSTRPEYNNVHGAFRFTDAAATTDFDTSGIAGVDAWMQHVVLSKFQQLEILQLREQSTRVGQVAFVRKDSTLAGLPILISERNTPALFGAGLLDTVPDAVLFEAANKKYHEFPEITGRVARLKGESRFGRFGWKGQKASLEGFVRLAAASELGLNAPGEPQAIAPTDLRYQPPGIDLADDGCRTIARFVASLAAPREQEPKTPELRESAAAGKKLFTAIGCANCHLPELGTVSGAYTDLLLHDMGPLLVGSADSNVKVAVSNDDSASSAVVELTGQPVDQAMMAKVYLEGALANEWRTPPLWGAADSGPYLHDGRAQTLEQAIAWHGGEATRTTRKYFQLRPEKRQQLLDFLDTLRAP